MKRILVLNYEFPPLGGGAGNATYYLFKEFSKYSDIEIDLVTSSIDKFKIEKFAPNINIHYLDINKKGNLHYQSIKDLLNYSWKAYWYCKKLKKQKSFNLVHAFFGVPCGYIAMKLKIPYIVSLRGSDVPFTNEKFYWLDRLFFKNLSKKIWKKANSVITNSEGLKDLAKKISPNQEINVIYNGVDIKEFCPLTEKNRNTFVNLISVGRLSVVKGYEYLIKSMSGLDNCKLTIIGSGPLENELKNLAKDLNVIIDFLGRLEKKEVIKNLQKADIFISPSLNEGMSNSILEAMACGLPIITTDTGGSKELIDNNGFIVEKKNIIVIKEAIKEYLKNSNLAYENGINSRKIVEKMSWKIIAEKYKKLYYV